MTSARMNIPLILLFGLMLGTAAGQSRSEATNANIDWHGEGRFRVLVRVAPSKPIARAKDELPAELRIDFCKRLKQLGIDARPNLSKIQVQRYERGTGKAESDGRFAYGRTTADRPFRWLDAAIPYEFPEFANAVSRTNGKIVRRPKVRGGYFYNAIGEWQRGRLTWMHTQSGQQPSFYAIYFDLLDDGREPTTIPPRGWIGDGLPRCDQVGSSTMGADHCRLDLDDWNGDGLVDLIVGEHYGHVFWWPNLGTRSKPIYRYARFIMADDKPLDAGIGAAPKVVDWDGDGRKDLLVGTHWNRVLFYKNTGSNRHRHLVYQGPISIDGKPLQVPIRPLTRGSSDVFKRDYYPVPETADWDGDGDLDLLLGGYVTGLIFVFENQGHDKNGRPNLRPRGPILENDKPLNVRHWCASPLLADFDGDGDLDLMSGNMPMYVRAGDRQSHANDFLQLHINHGHRQHPTLRATAFPADGQFPRERLATPRAFDWDNDGDLDLVVSARYNVYMYRNVGSRTKPRFAVHANPLRIAWGLAPVAANQFRDWNRDGRPDVIRGYSVSLNSGRGNPYVWDKTRSILPRGVHIAHPSGIGDDWFWPFLDDLDSDSKVDVLFGDWYGHVWFHRNQSTNDQRRFDLKGFRLRLADGEPIKVGPINKDPEKDFDALQGARTVLTVADFDRDGLRDLVIGDTYGKIRFFRSAGKGKNSKRQPRFDLPIDLGDLGIRGLVDSTDWNGDGWPDVIASAANGRVRVFLNQGENAKLRFAKGFAPGLPPIVQPRVLTADLNGDGDEDLFLPSTQGSCFVERSFLKHGYAKAELIRIERREE